MEMAQVVTMATLPVTTMATAPSNQATTALFARPVTSSAKTHPRNAALVSGTRFGVFTTDSKAYWQASASNRQPKTHPYQMWRETTPYSHPKIHQKPPGAQSGGVTANSLIIQKGHLRSKLDQMELMGYEVAVNFREQYNIRSQAIESNRHAALMNTPPVDHMLQGVNMNFNWEHGALIQNLTKELDRILEASANHTVNSNHNANPNPNNPAPKIWEVIPNSTPVERIPSTTQLYAGHTTVDNAEIPDDRSTILPRAMHAASLFEGQSLMYLDNSTANANFGSKDESSDDLNATSETQSTDQTWYGNLDNSTVPPVTPEQDSGICMDPPRYPEEGNVIHMNEKAYRVFSMPHMNPNPTPTQLPAHYPYFSSTPRKTVGPNPSQSILEAINDAQKQRDPSNSMIISPLDASSKIKRALNPLATRIMENWYKKNTRHPYPSMDAAEVLANAGGITVEQVKKWFANKRLRNRNTRGKRELALLRRELRKKIDDDTKTGGAFHCGYNMFGEGNALPSVEGIFGGCNTDFGAATEYHV